MKRIFLILSLLASLTLDAQFVTTFAKNATESQAEGIMYYLPRNVIRVEFTIEATDYHIGPYAEFASQMLGTNDYIKENKSEYAIKNVDIQTITEADPNAVYYISPDEKSKEPMPNVILDNNGAILAIGYDAVPSNYGINNRNAFTYNDFESSERVEVSFVEILDNEVEIEDDEDEDEDEEGNKTPKPKQITKEDKAKTALDKIANIKSAYSDLIVGNQEVASGEILKFMAEDLKSIENEYVSLFKGKVIKYTYKKVVYVTPENNQSSASLSIAKLSKTEGFSDTNGKGETIRIQFDSQNSLDNITKMSDEDVNSSQINKLFYRIPASSKVKILVGNNVIAEKPMIISQFGYIKTVSVKNNKIMFNPNTGQIISIVH